MYCKHCGARNADDAAFCLNCGNPLATAQQRTVSDGGDHFPPGPSQEKKKLLYKDDNGKIHIGDTVLSLGALLGICGGVLAAIAALVLVLCLCTGRSWKSAVKTYYKASADHKVIQSIDVTTPKYILDYELMDNRMSRAQFNEACKLYQAHLNEKIAFDFDYAYEYKIDRDVRILASYRMSPDDVDDIDDRYHDHYHTNRGFVKDAREVLIAYTYYYNGKATEDTKTVTVIKVGKNWYFYDFYSDMLDDVIDFVN